jgi:cytochrome c biogenesis protein CcdA
VAYSNTAPPSRRLTVFLHPLLFVFGFTLVFVAGWGGTATLVGILLLTSQMFYISIWAQLNGLFIELPLGSAAVPSI